VLIYVERKCARIMKWKIDNNLEFYRLFSVPFPQFLEAKKSLPTRYSNLKIKSPFMKREEYHQTLCNISFPLIYMTPIPDDEEENVSKWKVLTNHFHSSAAATYKRRSGTQSSSHNSLISSSEEHPNSRKNEIRKLFLYFQVLFD
jgi:hypothetical protein